jgi:uncharacterized protein YjbI with pentapeptide repeats
VARSRSERERRWFTVGGRELRLAVQRRFLAGEGLEGLGLSAVGGRVDLRGIPLTADFALPAGAELRHLDISGANVANLGLLDCTVVDCLFDGADCQFWRQRGTAVADTSFAEADLRHSSLGECREGRGNHYRRVSFRSARLRGATTSAATYEDCDFSHAELDRVNF